MNKTLLTASLLMAAGIYSSSAVADSAVVTLNGELAPVACTMAITNATVNLGRINLAELADGGHVLDAEGGFAWSAASAPLINVTCEGNAPLAFSFIDNRSATLVDAVDPQTLAPHYFGIGRFSGTAEAKSLGYLELQAELVSAGTVQGAIADAGNLIRSEDSWLTQTQVADGWLVPGVDVLHSYEQVIPGANALQLRLLGRLGLQDSTLIESGYATAVHNIDAGFTVAVHF